MIVTTFTTSELAAYVAGHLAAERERCARLLHDAAMRLSEGRRTNQVDRHVSHVLLQKADEIRALKDEA